MDGAKWFQDNRAYLGLVVLAVAVGAAAIAISRPQPAPIQVVAGASQSPVPTAEVVVHVAGAVHNPGLYSLTAGSRVADAIQSAGGALDEADVDQLNLAAKLVDAQKITVPVLRDIARGTEDSGSPLPGLSTASSTLPRKINVNTASMAELDTLPGIGPVTARRILDYRQRNGPFPNVDRLREARLVNNSTYEKIKDLVTAE